MRPLSAGSSSGWLTRSLVVLVLANIVPLYGMLVLGWDVFPLLMLYWLENVAIGLLNVPRMLLASGPVGGAEWQAAAKKMRQTTSAASMRAWIWGAKGFVVAFFCLHYGVFALTHGSILTQLFGPEAITSEGFVLGPGVVWHIIRSYGLGLSVIALVVSHAASFAWNDLAQREHRHTNIVRQMAAPYVRVTILHGALLLGGGLVALIGSPPAALVVLIALKVGLDGRAHLREHDREQQDTPPPENAPAT